MSLFLLIILIAFVFLIDSSQKSENKSKYQENERRGLYDQPDLELHNILRQDFCRDWVKYTPEEYRAYIARNDWAFRHYQRCWVMEQEMKAGKRPYNMSYDDMKVYDKKNFDPYESFRKTYGKRIQILNETGVYYY